MRRQKLYSHHKPASKVARVILAVGGGLLIVSGLYVLYVTMSSSGIVNVIEISKFHPPVVTDIPKDSPPPTQEQKASYTVPPSSPRYLIIPKLGIDTTVIPMGLTDQGALEAPKTAWTVGWYKNSDSPGLGQRALVIDGHVNSALGSPGIFYNLSMLREGDEVTVVRGDDRKFTYEIRQVIQVPLEEVDMKKMQISVESGVQGLNMITCGGVYSREKGTYTDRLVIHAVLMKD